MIISRYYGISKEHCNTQGSNLKYSKYKIRTALGDSKDTYLTSYSDNNLVVDATAVAVNDPQIQQENKYQCGHKRKQMIMQ
jgi:hypothetical protein